MSREALEGGVSASPFAGELPETPVALVNLERARQNAGKVASYAREHGLSWRPHVKTHKSRTLARIQLEEGAEGLTVATLREAEVMASVCDDLLLAYPPVGEARARRLTELAGRVALRVALDSEAALETVAGAGTDSGREVGVLVELDVGMGRLGVSGADRAVELAARCEDTRGCRFEGLLFYPGHIRVPSAEQDEALEDLRRALFPVVEALEARGLAPRIVSGGSTPTLWRSHEISGLTEIRAGTAIFHDRDTVSLGVATEEEVAYHVLATVVSTAVTGRAVVDAGSKALSKEEFRGGGGGYGVVVGRPEVTVAFLSEEHGVLDLSCTGWRPRVGETVRILPNHVCVSVNLQDRLLASEGNGFASVPLEARGRGPWARGD